MDESVVETISRLVSIADPLFCSLRNSRSEDVGNTEHVLSVGDLRSEGHSSSLFGRTTFLGSHFG